MNPMQSPNVGVGGKDHGSRKAMEKDTEQTRVIFRRYTSGEILALFPEIPAGGDFVESYLRFGQHGQAHYTGCISVTKPATPQEYGDLQKELESIGYNLLIRKRR